ncbi:hypothetical protein [Embleya sp. NPDC020886]|uniref:hypothetical protein n=1 Tax=Embleya sp. NPDC020886 TaxID=3363980 RepID=UPI00379D53EC
MWALEAVDDELAPLVREMLADADEGIRYFNPDHDRTHHRVEGRASTADPTTWPAPEPLRALPPRAPPALRARPAEEPGSTPAPTRDPAARRPSGPAAQRPSGPAVAAYHPDCPEALIPALVRRQPGYFSHGSIRSPAVARALIADPPVRDLPIRGLGDPLYEGLLTRSEIPTGARAAGHVLIVCHGYARDLVRTHLRDDADARTVASNPLRDFTGTPTELPTTAATVTS